MINTITLKRYSDISVAIAVAMAIISMSPWMFWQNTYHKYLIILFLFLRLIIFNKRISQRQLLSLYFLIPFAYFYPKFLIDPISVSIEKFFAVIIILPFIILFNNEERKLFLKWTINIFSILFFISLVAFAIKMFVYELPHTEIKNSNAYYPPFLNYYFFVIQEDWGLLTRFQGMITEPGHVGMISSLLLYVNRYSLKKWQNFIMTISLIWSFSLAGYLLYIIGLSLFLISKSKNPVKIFARFIFLIIILISTIKIISTVYPNSMVYELIISRLEFDETKGIKGNNRNTGLFEQTYNQFKNTQYYYQGMPTSLYAQKFSGTANSSYKTFVMSNGILGLLSLIFFIIGLVIAFPSRLGIGFMILIIISFIQRPYFTWEIESITYICLIPLDFSLQHNEENRKTSKKLLSLTKLY